MKLLSKPLIGTLFRLTIAGIGGILLITASLYLYLSPKLPTVETLKDAKLQTPLRIYSQDSKLIGEFGQQRRNPVPFDEIPKHYVDALLTAEDRRFYQHNGVDPIGLGRAVKQLLLSGQIQGGGSTLTMQVARNYSLSKKKTFTRKFNEILLSFRIEDEFTKDEIFTLYANKMFLGKRAYGIQAAAKVYYGKDINELSLAQLAMIAVLPQNPSTQNPIANPKTSLERRNWILDEMLQLDYIDQQEHDQAVAEPITAKRHSNIVELNAPYVSEMARLQAKDIIRDLNRQEPYQQFPINMMNDGLRIYTTVEGKLQQSARQSVRDGLTSYDWRHGYRGPERQYSNPEQWQSALDDTPVIGDLVPAIISDIDEQKIILLLRSGEIVDLDWEQELKNTRLFITTNRYAKIKSIADSFAVGDLVRLKALPVKDGKQHWALSQIPRAESALVSLSPEDGAIKSLVGGFDFDRSQYNRILSPRQPGSNFKPFIYTAALNSGLTAASTISGASISMEDAALEGVWQPKNDRGAVYGETRIRKALYKSINTVSVRLLKTIGISAAIREASHFGFDPNALPRNLTLTLGSHAVPPIKIATGYAVFANGGYLVEPYLIERIEDVDGNIIYQANPIVVPKPTTKSATQAATEPLDELGELEKELEQLEIWQETTATHPITSEVTVEPREAPRIIEPRVAYIMDSMLKDVIRRGTGVKAKKLNRSDIAGKTGTTNEAKDAWFSGYSPHLVTTTWVGFDDNSSLGNNEFGGSAALPIWINFMRTALNGVPEKPRTQPDGLVTQVRIDPETGKRVRPNHSGAIFEIFRKELLPTKPENRVSSDIEKELLNEELL